MVWVLGLVDNLRKAGLWELKMVKTGSPMPEMTMQHCTDASTDKQMSTSFSPGKETCAKQDIQNLVNNPLPARPDFPGGHEGHGHGFGFIFGLITRLIE